MLDKYSKIPYYLQIYTTIKERIDEGIYKTNHTLPPESQLVKEFDVTRVTVRNALHKLKEENTIKTLKGVGSIVVEKKPIEQSLFQFYNFGRDYKSEKFESTTKTVHVTKDVFEETQDVLKTNEESYRIERIRMLEGNPVILEVSYIPAHVAMGIETYNFEKNSIYDILENHYNVTITHAKEYLEPTNLSEDQAKQLNITRNTPVFKTERITFTNNDVPIEYRVSYIKSDKFKFYTEFKL